MGFCFEKQEAMQKAVRRLGCQRIEHALKALELCARSEGIHSARKDIKKARAVSHLVREHLSRKQFRAINRQLQKAAGGLAKPRDAGIRVATLRDLTRRSKADLPTQAFRQYRIKLRRDYDKAMRKFAEKKRIPEACRHLRAVKHAFERIEIDAEGWEAVAPGLKQTYRQCRDAHQRAAEQISAKRFHEWRKRAKNLWHQLVLLKPIWSEKLDRMACELETVGDLLGEDHDLFVLEQTVLDWQSDDDKLGRPDLNLLQQMIHHRQAELRQKALAMGKYSYAEKPSKFCKQLEEYWDSWVRSNDSRKSSKGRKGAGR